MFAPVSALLSERRSPMPDRQTLRVAVSLSCLGLIADLAYFQVDVAVRFMAIGEWAPGVAYAFTGASCALWLATIGWGRVEAALTAARGEKPHA